jgi:AraC-like DNA-binding protein
MINRTRVPAALSEVPIPVQSFSTDAVAPNQRSAYWKEAVCDAIANVDVTCRNEETFRGSVRWRGVDLGYGELATFTEVGATPQNGRRGVRQIARETDAFIGVTFQRKGTATIEQFGRNDILRPGDVWLLDSTQHSNIDMFEAFDQLLLKIPRDRLVSRLPRDGHWRGRPLRGTSPLGQVLNAHVEAVTKAIDRLDPDSRAALLETTIDLIALAFTEEAKTFAGNAGTVRRGLVLRATRFIDGNLANPALSAVTVAAALGVSPGYLQHAFQDVGKTVGTHIRLRRLERCREDLADPLHAGEQISEIAMRWGFNDMPHFSRAFKQQFGHGPREYRSDVARHRMRDR